MTVENLGAIESRKRTIFGAAMLVFALVLIAIFSALHVRGPWLLALFVPFWLAALGLLQGRART